MESNLITQTGEALILALEIQPMKLCTFMQIVIHQSREYF